MHGLRVQGFLMWLEFIEEFESIPCKDSKSHVDLMWQHLKGSFSYISFPYLEGIPNTSRKLRGRNIRKQILAIKTKFPNWIPTLKVTIKTLLRRARRFQLHRRILIWRICFYYHILFNLYWKIIFNLGLF